MRDFFLKLTGIDGESQDAKHAGEIDVLCWDWKITQKSSMHSGSGGGAGKATVGDLVFDHYIDRASPNLFKYCVTGKHIESAVLAPTKESNEEIYEQVNAAQNASLQWLVKELTETLNVSMQEIYRHPEIGRKNLTEASTAKW